jgi:hypothetical protein
VIADADRARGRVEELDGTEPSASILSEEQYMQRKLDLAGRGVRLRAGSPGRIFIDGRSARGPERSITSLPEEQRPAA